jgi:hypothetical protein
MPIRHSHPGIVAALWTGDLVLLFMLWPTPFSLSTVGPVLVMWLVPTIPLALATSVWRHPRPKHVSSESDTPVGHTAAWIAVLFLVLLVAAFISFLGRLDATPRFGAIATAGVVIVVGYGLYWLLDNLGRWR